MHVLPTHSTSISIPGLRAVLNGRVIAPGDAAYDEARVREAYPGSTWDRLVAIKARYDPTNLFRLNQNIRPAIEHPRPEEQHQP